MFQAVFIVYTNFPIAGSNVVEKNNLENLFNLTKIVLQTKKNCIFANR